MKMMMTIWATFLAATVCAFGDVTTVTAERAAALLKKDAKIVVVDIRTPDEFAEGHIKGAINIDMNAGDFGAKLAKLDRKKTYVMHCKGGGRSEASLPVWKRLGFENVLHLSSGILGWEKAGQSLVVPEKK